jgi:hypothetical protein
MFKGLLVDMENVARPLIFPRILFSFQSRPVIDSAPQ